MSDIIVRTQTINAKQRYYLSKKESFLAFDANFFDRHWLKEHHFVFSEALGRAIATMFNWDNHQLVLKECCRGGLPAKLSRNKYFYAGIKRTRVYKEFKLLSWMAKKGLPVSTPCFAEIEIKGALYQAKIITQYIANSTSLADSIAKKALAENMWKTVGSVIKRFHQQQVCHADLNACNILLVGDDVSLIDFDQSVVKKGQAWKKRNLNRLKRSLLKIQKKSDLFYFTERDWDALLKGYCAVS